MPRKTSKNKTQFGFSSFVSFEVIKRNKIISGYATDVVEDEFDNIKKSPIIKNINKYNIIVTPHLGGMTQQGQLRAWNFAVDKFKNK